MAVRLFAASWRWADVPILIRAGKCLPVTATEISTRFHRPPHDVFGLEPSTAVNWLRFRIWPQSRVSLGLIGKKPGAAWVPRLGSTSTGALAGAVAAVGQRSEAT